MVGRSRIGAGIFGVVAVAATVGSDVGVAAGAAQPSTGVVPYVQAVAAGASHTLVVKSDGTLMSFGLNVSGQLGRAHNSGTFDVNATPTKVMSGVARVAAGGGHSLVVKSDGTLWAFGANAAGQMGDPATSGSNENPTPVRIMSGVVQASAGYIHSLVLKSDGTAWAFGENYDGELGTTVNSGVVAANATPAQVMSGVAQVSAGFGHSLALKTDGTLWAFGDNHFGQLGTTVNSGKFDPNPTPVQVMSDVAQVDAGGSNHTVVLKTDGTVWTFGQNTYGQLGFNKNVGTPDANPTPTKVMKDAVQVAAGAGGQTFVLKRDGTVWGFGLNQWGQLGVDANAGTQEANPAPIDLGVSAVAAIVGGTSSSFIVKRDGALLSFGKGTYGELGRDVSPPPTPLQAQALVADPFHPTPTQVMADVATQVPLQYRGITPARLLDTRPGASTVDGVSAGEGQRAAGSSTALTVAGRAGLPANPSSVLMNVTAIDPQGDGYLAVYPCDNAVPNASNVNYVTGTTVSNLVIAKAAADGTVCIYTSAATQLLVDAEGHYALVGSYVGLTPARLLDTRLGATTVDGAGAGAGPRSAGSTTAVAVNGRGGVAGDAGAVAVNVTATNVQGSGYVSAWACDQPRPEASNINFATGATMSGMVIVKPAADGTMCLYTESVVDLIADVEGYFVNGSAYQAITALRLADTRPGAATFDHRFAGTGALTAGSVSRLPVVARGDIPLATTITITLTVVAPRADGFATVWPCDRPRPNASAINFRAGQVISNLAVVPLADNGSICVYTSADTDAIVDLDGTMTVGI